MKLEELEVTPTPTYQELVLPYRVMRMDAPASAEHEESMRKNGIDPEDNWALIASFETEEAALEYLGHQLEDPAPWETWRMVKGERQYIERVLW